MKKIEADLRKEERERAEKSKRDAQERMQAIAQRRREEKKKSSFMP